MPGFATALIAKLAGLGTVAKAAIATATAVLTMALAGGASGVLPLPGGHADSGVVVQGALDHAAAAVGSATKPLPPPSGGTDVQAAAGASVTPPTGSASTHASTGVATPTAGTSANLPTVPDVTVAAVPACVTNLVPTGATVPDPVQLVSQLPACVLSVVTAHLPLDTIQAAIGSANLPVNVSGCLSSVLTSLPALVGGNMSGLAQLLSHCLPTGSIPGIGGSIPGAGSIPGIGGSIPGMNLIPGFTPRS